MAHFTLAEAAKRYDQHRPKVHACLKDWLKENTGKNHFDRALDVACGTGDSTMPLLDICDEVSGIDLSEQMLVYAKAKGINAQLCSYDDINSSHQFDLITTCMAFHWFDPETAIKKYKSLSADGAYWLIYNFYFYGSFNNQAVNDWLVNSYLKDFPTPPRGKYSGSIPHDDPQIKVIKEDKGSLELSFTLEELVAYLTTQSNVEAVVKEGRNYQEVEKKLMADIPELNSEDKFNYAYSYGIYQYQNT